jgi:serine/threonine protein kinase
MTLASGIRLGPYEILSPLGAGGMGEVYRARDTRLERTVAVKVLPPHFSCSAEVRQRFERERRREWREMGWPERMREGMEDIRFAIREMAG